MEKINIKKLFQYQGHLGHMAKYRHPQNTSFIYKKYHGQDVIDLNKTYKQIEDIKVFLNGVLKENILLVTKNSFEVDGIKSIKKWKPGMLTNYKYSSLNCNPKVIICESVKDNQIMIKEAKKMNIIVVGLCDTNVSYKSVDKPIVINDDNSKCNDLVISYLLS